MIRRLPFLLAPIPLAACAHGQAVAVAVAVDPLIDNATAIDLRVGRLREHRPNAVRDHRIVVVTRDGEAGLKNDSLDRAALDAMLARVRAHVPEREAEGR